MRVTIAVPTVDLQPPDDLLVECVYPLPRLQRLYQVLSFRMLDTAKKRGVTRLY